MVNQMHYREGWKHCALDEDSISNELRYQFTRIGLTPTQITHKQSGLWEVSLSDVDGVSFLEASCRVFTEFCRYPFVARNVMHSHEVGTVVGVEAYGLVSALPFAEVDSE